MNGILDEIDLFLKRSKMRRTTFGRKAVNDGKFVDRLKKGGRCWPETEQRVREFIASQGSAK